MEPILVIDEPHVRAVISHWAEASKSADLGVKPSRPHRPALTSAEAILELASIVMLSST